MQKVLKPDQVNIAEHNFILRLSHEKTGFHCAVLLEQSLGALLELLRTDFFRSHALWNDERAAGDLPEPLCKDLCVDDVALNDVQVVVFTEGRVH